MYKLHDTEAALSEAGRRLSCRSLDFACEDLDLPSHYRAAVPKERRQLFVIGYSLPDTDGLFKYLYAIGGIGERTLRSFDAFDPNAQD